MVVTENTNPGMTAAQRQAPRHVRLTKGNLSLLLAGGTVAIGVFFYLVRNEIKPVAMTVNSHIEADSVRDAGLLVNIARVEGKCDKNTDKVDNLREALHRIELRQEAQNAVLPLPRHVRRSLPPIPEDEGNIE